MRSSGLACGGAIVPQLGLCGTMRRPRVTALSAKLAPRFSCRLPDHDVRLPRPDRSAAADPRRARLPHADAGAEARRFPPCSQGRDLMAAAQTGTGKTAAFALPLLQRLSMRRPAGDQQFGARAGADADPRTGRAGATELPAYGQNLPLRSYAVYGGVSINPQMMALRKGIDVLVATPGRLLDLYRQNAVQVRPAADAGARRGRPHARPGLRAGARRSCSPRCRSSARPCCSRPPSPTRSARWPGSCCATR